VLASLGIRTVHRVRAFEFGHARVCMIYDTTFGWLRLHVCVLGGVGVLIGMFFCVVTRIQAIICAHKRHGRAAGILSPYVMNMTLPSKPARQPSHSPLATHRAP